MHPGLHCELLRPSMALFKPLNLLNFDFNADSDQDLYPAFNF